jgi:hypothetical protein
MVVAVHLEAHSRQKSLNLFGASAVETAVLVIDRWLRPPPKGAELCVPEAAGQSDRRRGR